MAKWLVANKRADFQTIAQQYGISPVLARLIRNRGITDENGIAEYLHGDMRTLRDPFLLTDMEKAADIVSETIRRGGKIRIVGDYDVDGICSAHILRTAFATLGADADAVLPDRVKDGYGMNVRIVEEAQRDGRDTLVTGDNGIAAMEAVTRAKELGMTVVVTDHHEVPFEMGTDGERRLILPPADAVVDPQRDSGEEAEKDQVICGAVVAFKLAQAVFARMGQSFSQTQEELLPMCALATVCDVMPLSGQNRVIVREGLARMQSCENTGLRALLQVTGLAGAQITCFHAGFVLGPCLNASGRLTSAQMALSLFGEKDESRALQAAQELKDLNDSRKSMTQRGVEQAVLEIPRQCPEGGADRILVLVLEDVHESIAGIIAGKIRERTGRPSFVLTRTGEGLLKGSGRSTENYDMYEGMSACGDLLVKFGGHKMAGGLTMRPENLEEFRRRINELCPLPAEELADAVHIDMELPPSLLTMDTVRSFSLLEPCGKGNPEPLFVTRDLILYSRRVMGKNRNVIRFTGKDQNGAAADFIWFGDEETCPVREVPAKCAAVYSADINEWNGRSSLQYVLKDFRF